MRLSHICKRFGAVLANSDVDLNVASGTIHGLVGENGAGKSTLMSILYGFYTADSGSIELEGKSANITNSHTAIALGVSMVHQHFMLVDNLSALDNVLLGVEPHFSLPRSQSQARAQLDKLMQDTGLKVSLDTLVEDLSVGDRQRLEILKALHRGARILILDEPTAVLTAQETEQLFDVLRRLRAQGKTIILITHKLREVLALCDTVTVMRAGKVVHECPVAGATIEQLAEAMVGRKLRPPPVRTGVRTDAPVLLRVQNLRCTDAHGVPRLRGVSLHVAAGEILGVAGVAGNGQTELLEILSGIHPPQSGTMEVCGQRFTAKNWLDPQTARHLGMAHVPEDRQSEGLIMEFTAWENVAFGHQNDAKYQKNRLFMNNKAIRADTAAKMARFDVRPPNPLLTARNFSGGNQQKLVVAREIESNPDLLLIGQPTRGVDIGAIEFIHKQIVALRDQGKAILLVSVELDEIMSLSDRIAVMFDGQIMGERLPAQTNARELGLLMAGIKGEAA